MLVLKHLRHWSFDECEREVRGSLVHRAFCRIGCERVPDAKTLIRLGHLIDPETLQQLLERLVDLGRQRRVIHGRRLHVDTIVVKTTGDRGVEVDVLSLAVGARTVGGGPGRHVAERSLSATASLPAAPAASPSRPAHHGCRCARGSRCRASAAARRVLGTCITLNGSSPDSSAQVAKVWRVLWYFGLTTHAVNVRLSNASRVVGAPHALSAAEARRLRTHKLRRDPVRAAQTREQRRVESASRWSAGPATVTPEDTLRAAGIDDARQAEFHRRMSALLAGRP